jgi:hypothetical protein
VDTMVNWKLSICLWPVHVYVGIIFLFGVFKVKHFFILTTKLSCNSSNQISKCNY